MPAKSDGNHSDDAEDDDMDSDDEPALLGPLRAASGKAGAKRSAGSSGAGAVSGRPATSGTSGSTRSSGDTPSREIINTTQDGRFSRLKEGLEKEIQALSTSVDECVEMSALNDDEKVLGDGTKF